jgi:VIT1/CCC1 family predicted Fe2+/Mn2+ transporter
MERGRPPEGLGHYLRDVVNGAVDGVITTLAVLAGASGAELEARVGVILGIANLVADGLSMGASNYLALKSELQQNGASIADEMPLRHGLATAAAFALFGAVPLLAYLAPRGSFAIAVALAVLALIAVGAVRARFAGKRFVRCATEVVAIALAASVAAYSVGAAAGWLTR